MELHRGAARNLERMSDPIFAGAVNAGGASTPSLRVFAVQFVDGGHTTWHRHTSDQILIVTEGRGIVATDDQEIEVEPGDIVVAPAGERHWHGAAPGGSMTHIAVLGPGDEEVLEDPRG
jgi:quercetin dioxygenase-like cupin family protein